MLPHILCTPRTYTHTEWERAVQSILLYKLLYCICFTFSVDAVVWDTTWIYYVDLVFSIYLFIFSSLMLFCSMIILTQCVLTRIDVKLCLNVRPSFLSKHKYINLKWFLTRQNSLLMMMMMLGSSFVRCVVIVGINKKNNPPGRQYCKTTRSYFSFTLSSTFLPFQRTSIRMPQQKLISE